MKIKFVKGCVFVFGSVKYYLFQYNYLLNLDPMQNSIIGHDGRNDFYVQDGSNSMGEIYICKIF